jgi:hypothetical protein
LAKPDPVSKEEFYRRVDAGDKPYSKKMGLKPGQAYSWLKSRPTPTKVAVTVTPPRPTAEEPKAPLTTGEPLTPVVYLTEEECIDLYVFVWGREGLIADGLLGVPEAGRSNERCKTQGSRLYQIAVKYGWDREQVLGFLGIALFGVGCAQDSWTIYKAWSAKQDEKKSKEKKPEPFAPVAEVQVDKSTARLIESRLGGPPKL